MNTLDHLAFDDAKPTNTARQLVKLAKTSFSLIALAVGDPDKCSLVFENTDESEESFKLTRSTSMFQLFHKTPSATEGLQKTHLPIAALQEHGIYIDIVFRERRTEIRLRGRWSPMKKCGDFHRSLFTPESYDDLPAIEYQKDHHQTKIWCCNGMVSRSEGPSVVREDCLLYSQYGLLHREKDPAVVTKDFKIWFSFGVCHQEEGDPAIVTKTKEYRCEHGRFLEDLV